MDLIDKITEMRKEKKIPKKLRLSFIMKIFVIFMGVSFAFTLCMMIYIGITSQINKLDNETYAKIIEINDTTTQQKLIISKGVVPPDTIHDTLQLYDDTTFQNVIKGDSLPLFYLSKMVHKNSIDRDDFSLTSATMIKPMMIMMTLVWGGPFFFILIYSFILRYKRINLWQKGKLTSATVLAVEIVDKKHKVSVAYLYENKQHTASSTIRTRNAKEFIETLAKGDTLTITVDRNKPQSIIILDPFFTDNQTNIPEVHQKSFERKIIPPEISKEPLALLCKIVPLLFILMWIFYPFSSAILSENMFGTGKIDSVQAIVEDVSIIHDTARTTIYSFDVNSNTYYDTSFAWHEDYSGIQTQRVTPQKQRVGDSVLIYYNEKDPTYNYLAEERNQNSPIHFFIAIFLQFIMLVPLLYFLVGTRLILLNLWKKGIPVQAQILSATQSGKLLLSYEINGKEITASGKTNQSWLVQQWVNRGTVTIIVHPWIKKFLMFPELYMDDES